MIDVIFDLIMKEARSRKGEDLNHQVMIVLFDVTDKVLGAIQPALAMKLENISFTFTKDR